MEKSWRGPYQTKFCLTSLDSLDIKVAWHFKFKCRKFEFTISSYGSLSPTGNPRSAQYIYPCVNISMCMDSSKLWLLIWPEAVSESLIDVHIDSICACILVSTHVVCERLSAMQGHPECGMAKYLLILPRILILNLTTLGSPQIEIWPELGTLSFDYLRTPPTPMSVWKLTTVSPTDTVSLVLCEYHNYPLS